MNAVVVGGLVAAGAAALYIIALFNKLVRLRNRKDNAWAQIDVQLTRRHDLIPNLVETVKGYAQHERETLERVTAARSQAVAASGVRNQAEAETTLNRALGQFFAVLENYPDLKASANFLALQEELVSTENKIGFARQHYNDTVMRLNTAIQSFPSNVIAGVFGFAPAEFFEVDTPGHRTTPAVSLE